MGKCSGTVVACSTRDREAAGPSLNSVTAFYIYIYIIIVVHEPGLPCNRPPYHNYCACALWPGSVDRDFLVYTSIEVLRLNGIE